MGILLSYPCWWILQCVVDRETDSSVSFLNLEISSQLANREEIRILFSRRSSLADVLDLEPHLDRFEQVHLVIFDMVDWELPKWTAISFWVLPATNNAWMIVFVSLTYRKLWPFMILGDNCNLLSFLLRCDLRPYEWDLNSLVKVCLSNSFTISQSEESILGDNSSRNLLSFLLRCSTWP